MSGHGRIYVCQPTYGGGSADSHRAFWSGACREKSPLRGRIVKVYGGRSLLANTFNSFWCHALNLQEWARLEYWQVELAEAGDPDLGGQDPGWYARNRKLGIQSGPFNNDVAAKEESEKLALEHHVSHFAMLHDDVCPQEGWLDQLLGDLEEHSADVMSAVVPIKDEQGLTSTAIDDPEDPWNVERRITMTELMRLPEVFGAADCGYPDRKLLVNTGCWICRLDREWRRHVSFTIRDRIVYKDGKWTPEVASEDWNFSRDVQELGGKVMATRRVMLKHAGEMFYPNSHGWGNWKHDHHFAAKFGGRGILEPEPMLTEEDARKRLNGAVRLRTAQALTVEEVQ